ncbi:MAG: LysR family transcriptional regulator, partial [Desulfosalsimonadaceae bacterium]|nr:LysR family transcriptional regulator [Desulfosalsimonadaceae bacterium]
MIQKKFTRSMIGLSVFFVLCAAWPAYALQAISREPYLGAIVIDAATGEVISEDQADAKGYPASMIKLMNLLVVLDALLEERHISRAATRLAMTQPAVSHALNRLRDLIGDPLLVRVGNEMRLTAKAAALLRPLADALTHVRNVVMSEPFSPENCQRTFRLGMSDYGSAVVLPGLLQRLRAEAPGVNLVVIQSSRLEMLR